MKKTPTKETSYKPVSKCCYAPMKVTHGCDDDLLHGGKKCTCTAVTTWYECTKCGESCDIADDNKVEATTKQISWEEKDL